jgi:peptide/nickel transport system permease protein
VARYILTRLLLMVPTLLGVAVLTFVLLRVVPGDVVTLKYAGEGAFVPHETIEAERARLGLDQPLWRQFVDWIAGVVRFDFGTSMWTGRPIAHEIAIRFELSLQLAIMATIVAVIIAIPLGVASALWQDTWIDHAIRVVSIGGLATPSFWLGILMILGLLTLFRWSPPVTFTPFLENPLANLSLLIWPALAVGYRYSAVATRMTRSAMLEVLREDYVRTARAKGVRLPDRRPRGHRAGVQLERPGQAHRRGDQPPRLHADAGARAALGDRLRAGQLPGRSALRGPRPPDSLRRAMRPREAER